MKSGRAYNCEGFLIMKFTSSCLMKCGRRYKLDVMSMFSQARAASVRMTWRPRTKWKVQAVIGVIASKGSHAWGSFQKEGI